MSDINHNIEVAHEVEIRFIDIILGIYSVFCLFYFWVLSLFGFLMIIFVPCWFILFKIMPELFDVDQTGIAITAAISGISYLLVGQVLRWIGKGIINRGMYRTIFIMLTTVCLAVTFFIINLSLKKVSVGGVIYLIFAFMSIMALVISLRSKET